MPDMFRVILGAGVVSVVVAALAAPPAHAGAGCEPRSAAHISEHGGLTADSAWHVSHGQRPTCGSESKSSYSNNDQSPRRSSGGSSRSSDYSDDYDEGEGRYCDGRWWC